MRRNSQGRPFLSCFRVLLPSWKFFVETRTTIHLELRCSLGWDVGPWVEALPPEPRSFLNLFLNPRGNLQLAGHTAVERLVNELHDAGDASVEELATWPAYKIVRGLATALAPHAFLEPPKAIQFRVLAKKPGERATGEELLVSEEVAL